ncbi:hypothetical protein [Amycolatopsis sp. WGS_07]|uniref:hypothetical protein n=1 Tax=Amycolatopsis sp. WGS_07 TaxID=3076764 RepID=UPI00387317A5
MTPPGKPKRTATRLRRAAAALLCALASGLAGGAASAEPESPLLEKYVPASPEWARSPWAADGPCAARGGDVSRWAASLVSDTTVLLRRFQPRSFVSAQSDPGAERGRAVLAGYAKLASVAASAVPRGYCAADLAGWSGTAGGGEPFGIRWQPRADGDARPRFSCDPDDPADARIERLMGAQQAMCDGFAVRCANAAGPDAQRCALWNDFSAAYVREVNRLRTAAIEAHPAQVEHAPREWSVTGAGLGFLVVTGILAVAVLVVAIRARRARPGARRGGV